jgi:hypothetical protein
MITRVSFRLMGKSLKLISLREAILEYFAESAIWRQRIFAIMNPHEPRAANAMWVRRRSGPGLFVFGQGLYQRR